MNSLEITKLLNKVKIVVRETIETLKSYSTEDLIQYSYLQENKREMKAKVDDIMNQVIFNQLEKIGIPIRRRRFQHRK